MLVDIYNLRESLEDGPDGADSANTQDLDDAYRYNLQ